MVCGRYAPSPTGRLHLGNLGTALSAWLQVRLQDGRFILRIDDLDQPRNRPGSMEQIIKDLRWLGLDWDEGPDVGGDNGPYLQSQRSHHYQAAFDQLRQSARLFPCGCSRKDIAEALSAPHGASPGKVYPGTCRPGTPSTFDQPSDQNSTQDFAWRFAVDNAVVTFNDQVMGEIRQRLADEAGDFVVRRRDGLTAYQLATVVDDQLMAVTDVVRGADLVGSTPRQLSLIHALDYTEPRYWHVPLLMDEHGARMSKRDGTDSLVQWQAAGKTAADLTGFLAHASGLTDSPAAISCEELRQSLDISEFRRRLKKAMT